MPWLTHPPVIEPGSMMRVVPDAVLSPFHYEQVDERRHRVTGAVYADRRLIPQSQRVGGRYGDRVKASDPDDLPYEVVVADLPRYRGRWLYGGNIMSRFGHFLLESLTTLWPRGEFDGILFHPFIFDNSLSQTQRTLIAKLHGDIPVEVVADGAVVDELVVPDRPVVLNVNVTPQAVDVWNRVAFDYNPTKAVFMSRSLLPKSRRWLKGDEALDEIFADAGFEVVHPETLSIDEQLRIMSEAAVVAGPSGSAVHLSVCSSPQTYVLEVGDMRSPNKALRMQHILSTAKGQPFGHLPLIREGKLRDLRATSRRLEDMMAVVPL